MLRTPLQRALAALATPGVLVALVAFFMPWYVVSCGDLTLATASGYDAARSGFHAPAADPTMALGAGPARHLRSPAREHAVDDDSRSDPWLFALPLCALGALAAIVRAVVRNGSRRAIAIAAVCAFACTLLPMIHAIVLRARVGDAVAHRAGADPMQRGVALALEHSVQFRLEIGWYLSLAAAGIAFVATAAWWFTAVVQPPAQQRG